MECETLILVLSKTKQKSRTTRVQSAIMSCTGRTGSSKKKKSNQINKIGGPKEERKKSSAYITFSNQIDGAQLLFSAK
jgi:hypothetical protein